MIEIIKKKLQYEKSNYLLIGDRLETDILMGNKMGIDTSLVSSGIVNDLTTVVAQPNFILDSIRGVL